ncbi:hypothetical protein ILUMI_04477 [Ignelater luminosus]|uniref:Uncharacterized protein n=1 Tax=Ignelater luminosus TaxID=2038154 RepID=A0A8K0DEA0_IGNLU|nr:hypothetical protein ILUMI_04477 [Ignelater luminosus]
MEVRRQLISYLRQARADGARAHLTYDKLIVGKQIYKLQELKDNQSYKEVSLNTNRSDRNGNIITKKEKIIERWREYFVEFLNNGNSMDNKHTEIKSNVKKEVRIEENGNKIELQDVEQALEMLKTDKAPGCELV